MNSKVKKKMLINIRNIFCFLMICLCFFPANAQVVDIPLFDDEEEPPKKQQPVKKPIQNKKTTGTPAVTKTPPQQASKPISFSRQGQQPPNLGTSSTPLSNVNITPPPLSPTRIPLPTQKPQEEVKKPLVPVNTRTEAINIQPSGRIYPFSGSQSTSEMPVFSSDVRSFEIEGFYLGMTPEEIVQIANDRNYKITSSKKTISKFRTAYYENWCKKQGIYVPADIRACMAEVSKKNNTTYLSELKVERPKSREYIHFHFSSPATGNRVWKIYYQNKGDNSLNFTAVNTQKKLHRREAFLNAIFNKFGNPDNTQKLIWGSQDDSFMQVGMYGSNYDAYIVLTDVLLSDDDYFEAQDWLEENKPFEHFGFED